MAKKLGIIAAALLVAGILAFFNPSEKDFVVYAEEKFPDRPSVAHPDDIEKADLLLFSIYTPIVADEYGVSHLGIMGQFIELSRENLKPPIWMELFLR
ncbi:hypothetical protein D1B31_15155 [Neobacillus notoginsengisoli]|uniref:Uncharacterized protein n=1 Tax=Neobacillus notoginsengisoli TaxID=1578198 RepID=A0A417YS45_9BACI|nr:hypothetical protein [Neobacillus notoginsengisoli]RHW38112.1 hypothetical protein D1B31_15155 [Neobacillus notoginsengisoli]